MSAFAPVAQALPGGLDPVTVTTITAAAAAAVGAFVAYQAYRGYRRNASRAMLYLTAGVLLLTTVPFTVRWALVLSGSAGTTMGELAAQVCRIAGLLVVLYVLAGGPDSSRSATGGSDTGRTDTDRRGPGRSASGRESDAERSEGPDGERG